MLVYIPKDLDVDALIAQYPPQFGGFKKDFLLYILHKILVRAQYNKDSIYYSYVPLHSELLQKIKSNYKSHLDYLLEHKVVDCNGRYVVGKSAKGYRLNKRYGYSVKALELSDFVIKKKIKKFREEQLKTCKGLEKFISWFSEKLEIDYNLVIEYSQKKYESLQGREDLWETKRVKGENYVKKKQPAKQFQQSLLSALRLVNKDIYFKRDDTSYRLHHNLSNMPSILRNAVTYNGKTLYSLDIKNSQPYLSLCLLNPVFWGNENWRENEEKLTTVNHVAHESSKIISLLLFRVIVNYSTTIKHQVNYTMLGEVVKPLLNKGFEKYAEVVTSGKFYEILKTHFNSFTGESMTRKEVKDVMFLILFGGNKGGSVEDIKKRKIFKTVFPEVFEVFSAIKKKQKEILPCLLQTIESYLILEVICKRISKEYPKAPLFTIHDSIATTEQYIEIVKSIMIEELENAVGYKPTLSLEEWNPDVLKDFIKNCDMEKMKVA